MTDFPFIYSAAEANPIPLGLYLPQHRPGIVSAWLKNHPAPDGMVLTPFGSSPQAILEAARSGYRVLVPAHNPIIRFLINGLANPMPRDQLNSALVQLASGYKGSQRIKPLILSLYETECPHCGGSTSASSFIWSTDQDQPSSKICRCSVCGEETQGVTSAADLAKARQYRANSPIHARALTRVSAPDDPIRFQVEIALGSYPPRSVYALFTLLNKISGLDLTEDENTILERLLLYAFYRSSSPETRILTEVQEKTSSYREENIWHSLEEGLNIWSSDQPPIPVTNWPELPPESGGICLFPGRVRELIPQLSGYPVSRVLLIYPRPRMTIWALSALWTGWLWGQEAAAPFRNILSVKNYDGVWMSRAISTTLSELRSSLPIEVPYLGLLPELDPEYLLTSLSASSAAGLDLEHLTIEAELKIAITSWRSVKKASSDPILKDRVIIRQAGFELLQAAGEPKHTLHLYGAGASDMIKNGTFKVLEYTADPDQYHPHLLKDFDENIAYRQGFLHFSKTGKWWHQDLTLSGNPQADQVEQTLVNYLVRSGTPISEMDLYQHIYDAFPGLRTPDKGLIDNCLRSYAEQIPGDQPTWQLKQNDHPKNRIQDLVDIDSLLNDLGSELGFKVSSERIDGNIILQIWSTETTAHHNFYISVSGQIAKIMALRDNDIGQAWIIIPGSRANLIHYKMLHNPLLEDLIQKEWGLIKFRHLRRLADQGGLTHANLQQRLVLDPLTSESPQLKLI